MGPTINFAEVPYSDRNHKDVRWTESSRAYPLLMPEADVGHRRCRTGRTGRQDQRFQAVNISRPSAPNRLEHLDPLLLLLSSSKGSTNYENVFVFPPHSS